MPGRPAILPTLQNRRQKRQDAARQPYLRIGLAVSFGVAVLLTLALLAAAPLYTSLTSDLPSLDTLPLLLDANHGWLRQPTRLYDRSGEHLLATLQHPGVPERRYLPLDPSQPESLPTALVQATLAAFDRDFWQHNGCQWGRLGQNRPTTLAERLISDLLLEGEAGGLRRRLRECLLATQATEQYGRQQILEWFLNYTQYGPLIYGADSAAQAYLGLPASQIDLAQAALLTAAAQSPGLTPLEAPQLVLERQNQLIEAMFIQGRITAEQARQAAQARIVLQPAQTTVETAPALLRLALEQLATQMPTARLQRGGWQVLTTLDYDLQLQVECTVNAHAARVQTGLLPLAQSPAAGPADSPSDCQAARLLPTLLFEAASLPNAFNTAVIILDPQTGQVLSVAGQTTPGLDPTRLPGRPPGDLLTTFIYLTALSRGFNAASLVWDLPPTTADGPLESQPQYSAYRGPLRLRSAFANNDLAPADALLQQVGAANVLNTAHQLGVRSLVSLDSPDDAPSQQFPWLSGGQVTLLEMTQAFGALANRGLLVGQPLSASGSAALQPITVLALKDTDGKVWLDWSQPKSQPVLSTQLAYLGANLLSDETARWPSLGHPNPLEIGRPAGARLGASAQGDAWTVGFTPQRVVGVWVGSADPAPARISPLLAAGLWHALTQYAVQSFPPQGWEIPPGVNFMNVCDPSGLLPTASCPSVVSEAFLNGSEPTQPDTLYRAYAINRETGRLATLFTPPELIEERTYLVVPPEAQSWARQAGLPIPPDTYDVIYFPQNASPLVRIETPAMFAHVGGQVRITGSANPPAFQSYRLLAGRGLNPTRWTLLGEDSTIAVNNGLLGIWDTSKLSGLYAIQLQVLGDDQRITRSYAQVSIDNQPPQVTILAPSEGQSFSSLRPVVLQAHASDDLELDRLVFWVDGRLVATLGQAPFSVAWQPTGSGSHTLRVEAFDLAGNHAQVEVQFQITK